MTIAPVRGRSHEDCNAQGIPRVDLFCRTHQQFLPLANLPGWAGASALVSFAILLVALVLVAARTGTEVPVFVAAAVTGLALLVLPLRDLWPAWLVAGGAWAGICAAALVSFDGRGARLHATFALVLVVATGAVFAARAMAVAIRGQARHVGPEVRAAVPAAVLSALSLGALAVRAAATDPPFGAFRALPAGLSTALLLIGVFAAAAAILVVAGIAAIAGLLHVVGDEEWLIPAPARFRPLPRPAPPTTTAVRGRDPLSQITHAVARFVAIAAYAVLIALSVAGTVLLRIVHAAVVFLVGVANWILQFIVACATYLRETVLILAGAVWGSLRLTVVPVAALVVAALLSVHFAMTALHYLTSGDLVDVPELLGFVLAAVVALDAAWIAVCGSPLGEAIGSALHSIGPLSAWSLILVALGGWALWLLGPLDLGVITLGSTGLLLLIAVVGLLRRTEVRTAG
ncbi:hypothetical protein ACQPZJ_24080 [Actinoplanes sp. CA-054009]